MAKMQITAKPLAEVTQKAELPRPTVTSALEERDGVSGILVSTFYPLPDDEQVEVVERFGKGENKDKLTSRKSVYGRARAVALTYEENGETFGILDGEGNQIIFSGSILNVVKGEGADSEEDEETDTGATA
jgi:hypothetical protein